MIQSYPKKYLMYFALAIIIKILCMAIFSSDYENEMFIPFVQSYIDGSAGGNPYEMFYMQCLPQSFPYPPLMLIILSPFVALISMLQQTSNTSSPHIIVIVNLIFKLPLMIADIICALLLIKMCRNRRRYIGVVYFVSPVILYSTYMHGQLDIIPTTLLISALYCLNYKEKNGKLLFTLLLASAVLTKSHILLVVPLVFMFSIRKYGKMSTFKYGVFFLGVIALCILPFASEGFFVTVVLNNEQMQLFNSLVISPTKELLLPICAILVCYISYYFIASKSNNYFIAHLGLLFCAILLTIDAMPGWFVWIFPFATIAITQANKNRNRNVVIFLTFSLLYIVYFVFLRHSSVTDLYLLLTPINKLNMPGYVVKTVYSALYSVLSIITFTLVVHSRQYRKKNSTLIVISGDSGSGKSEMLSNILSLLDIRNTLTLEGDGDHKWERGSENYQQFNHLNPKANYLYRQSRDIEILKRGQAVMRRDYDHTSGNFTDSHWVKPKRYIILSGLHSLYLPSIRQSANIKIFMDTDPKLQRFWKITRDMIARGYTLERILEQIANRQSEVEKYITPQREFADMIIRYFDDNIPMDFNETYVPQLSLKLTISTRYDIEQIVVILEQKGIEVEHIYLDDIRFHEITICHESLVKINSVILENIACEIITDRYEITDLPIKRDGIEGLIQLVLLNILEQESAEWIG